MSKFVPIHGLDHLNEEQLQEYYVNACNYLKVPAELGLLYYRFVDSGEGPAKRMLLVKRGAAEIIRQNLQISVKSLVAEPPTSEYIAYQAIGTTPDGRQEIAVGAQSIKGGFAKEISNAPMAASTKALIRLTLQFAGGGFISDVELPEHKITQGQDAPSPAIAKIAETQAPTVKPNTNIGVDITPIPPTLVTTSVSTENIISPTVESTENTEKPKRKYVKRSKEVNLSSPGQAPEPPKVGDTVEVNGKQVQVAAVGTTVAPAPPAPVIAPLPSQEPQEPVAPVVGLPNAEELKGFKKRLSEYNNTYLSKDGGMVPSEGIGGVFEKTNLYFKKNFPTMVSSKELTKSQWSLILDRWDNIRASKGCESLVKHIEEMIGIGG